uniref:Uncharacterized protein n=1 Tax=Plectus sambesii TaxID=2011161 RepID=A0A914UL62_9BILA
MPPQQQLATETKAERVQKPAAAATNERNEERTTHDDERARRHDAQPMTTKTRSGGVREKQKKLQIGSVIDGVRGLDNYSGEPPSSGPVRSICQLMGAGAAKLNRSVVRK